MDHPALRHCTKQSLCPPHWTTQHQSADTLPIHTYHSPQGVHAVLGLLVMVKEDAILHIHIFTLTIHPGGRHAGAARGGRGG